MSRSQDYIIRIKAENDQLKRKLTETRGRLQQHNNKLQVLARQAAANLALMFGGVALGQVISSSIRKIAEFEFQMDKVAAVSGATAKEVKSLTDNALELGARSKFTATEIGKLQEELARLGFTTDQIVAMTDASRKLATVADSELGESAKTVGQVINAFGLEAQEATRVANVMAESFSKSALDLEKFQTAIGNVGAVAKNAGFSLEETTAMIGKLVDNGIDASTAGTQLRNVFLTLTQKGLTLSEALEKVRSAEDSNAMALELFEKRAVPVVVTLANMEEKTKILANTLSDSTKEMEDTVKVMEDNLLTDWKLLTSAMDGVIQKGGSLNPILRETVQNLTRLVNLVGEFDLKKILALGAIFGAGGIAAAKAYLKTIELLSAINNRSVSPGGPQQFPGLQYILDVLPEIQNTTSGLDRLTESISDLSNAMSMSSMGIDSKGFTDIFESLDFKSPDMKSLVGVGDDNPILKNLREQFEAARSEAQMQMDALNSILERGLVDGLAGFADGLATGGIENAFQNLFNVIGSGLQTLGKSLIAFGVSMEAFKKAFTNPVAAIVAGAAAIAAGALVKNAASNLSSVGGGVSSGGGGGRGFNSFQQQSVNVNLTGKLKADTREVYVALENYGNRNARVINSG